MFRFMLVMFVLVMGGCSYLMTHLPKLSMFNHEVAQAANQELAAGATTPSEVASSKASAVLGYMSSTYESANRFVSSTHVQSVDRSFNMPNLGVGDFFSLLTDWVTSAMYGVCHSINGGYHIATSFVWLVIGTILIACSAMLGSIYREAKCLAVERQARIKIQEVEKSRLLLKGQLDQALLEIQQLRSREQEPRVPDLERQLKSFKWLAQTAIAAKRDDWQAIMDTLRPELQYRALEHVVGHVAPFIASDPRSIAALNEAIHSYQVQNMYDQSRAA